MTLPRPKLLMACNLNWNSTFQVGSHHLARGFVAAGWDVAYLSNPLSLLQLARRDPGLRGAWSLYRRGGIEDMDGHLWAYAPGALLTPHNMPLLKSSVLYRGWWRLTLPSALRTVERRGFARVDLIYIDSPVQRFWLNRIAHPKSVMRVADRMSGFGVAPAFSALERAVASTVDLVAYTARGLRGDVAELGARRAVYLPNGVNFEHFARGDRSLPADLANIPRPIAIYVGAMDDWFDFATLNAMVVGLPDVSFVLIGPDREARRRLSAQSNLHLLGTRTYAELPSFLHNADIGLIPFDVRGHGELVNGIHPLKLYEYLACGLPVVATDWDEIRGLNSPAILCRTPEEHVAAVRAVLAARSDREKGVRFASAADWSHRVERLLTYLDLAASESDEGARKAEPAGRLPR